jgi:hypothetical protein
MQIAKTISHRYWIRNSGVQPSQLSFNEFSWWFWGTLKFEDHWHNCVFLISISALSLLVSISGRSLKRLNSWPRSKWLGLLQKEPRDNHGVTHHYQKFESGFVSQRVKYFVIKSTNSKYIYGNQNIIIVMLLHIHNYS